MKILSANQIYQADQATIKNESISSVDLMERAGLACFNWIHKEYINDQIKINVFCGMGNNGGDGLVIARLLIEKGYDVRIHLVIFSEKRSSDFQINLERLKGLIQPIYEISSVNDFPEIQAKTLIIDAIFGIGLKRSINGFTKELIHHINLAVTTTISIDIPSGLNLEKAVTIDEAVIVADQVLTFQAPKLAFLMPENRDYIGSWDLLDIGLDSAFLEAVDTKYRFLEISDIKRIYKKRKKFSHKGTYGHSLIIGGSFGKIGAVILASKAALKSGSGLVSSYIPKCGYSAIQGANPEVMVEVDDEKFIQFFNFKTKPTAVGVGPGLGTHLKTKKGFVKFYSNCELPMVIDADGLNIISEFSDLKKLIPKNTVLTPHPKEFERLVGKWTDDFDKLEKLKKFAVAHDCIVVLKGAYTAIANRNKVWFNSSGNPALATAGSGDVLTGMITALLAQGYKPIHAAIIGVFMHGRSADLAILDKQSMESFTASDGIDHIGKVFKELF